MLDQDHEQIRKVLFAAQPDSSLRPRSGIQLPQNALRVMFRRPRTDFEPRRDIRVRSAFSQKVGNLDLPGGELEPLPKGTIRERLRSQSAQENEDRGIGSGENG